MVLDTTTSSNPTIFVIPGGACPVVFYNDLVSTLTKQGFEAETHNLRSYTDDPKNAEPQGLTEDAAYMHEKIEALVDQGKEVVVVGHSYGGLVTTDAAHGLSKAERARAGKRGGIVRIIYLSCIVGAVGSNSTETCAGRLPEFDFMQPSEENPEFLRQSEKSAGTVFSDLPKEQADLWVSRQWCHSVRAFNDKIQYASYLQNPVTWIFCKGDEVLTPSFQRGCIEFIEQEKGKKIDVVELDVGHCPNVTATELTAKTIVEAVKRNA
ncbi:uncharacterized protein AB675_5297 [Cyphellophora attinorum]|uniref:AB hydrolase-1 domain-containing protein n=1 Tax=Cyphellophora attinorum TaxID=1664694 RepID=A0A0N1HBT7_9EURO|nr:uncharacterized protein AB675_5297 [Phialophora attinorum]KPI41920.1 hypothetical protein AB675_5297 [Phialophora attinorum]